MSKYGIGDKCLVGKDGSAKDRIVGFETEYGLQFLHPKPENIDLLRFYGRYLPKTDQFGEDGSRKYLDMGLHPEYSTAEDINFLDAAHRAIAGHTEMARLAVAAAELSKGVDTEKLYLVANTTDGSKSWGNHLNMLAPRTLEPWNYIEALGAHNLSKIVWSGVGRIFSSNVESEPYRFEISEKAHYIWELANNVTTISRPLVNLRDKPLADGLKYRRIHDISGETGFSSFVYALRAASMSIILRACEIGVDFGDLLPDKAPMAMKLISMDPSLQTRVELPDGSRVSGVELQKLIAERALKAILEIEYITHQERLWGERWIELLDNLAKGNYEAVQDKVEWIIKLRDISMRVDAGSSSSKKSVYKIASAVDNRYHLLTHGGGTGMRLLRKGFYEGSPSDEVIDNGLMLPPTRARLRAKTIESLKKQRCSFFPYWHLIELKSNDKNRAGSPADTIHMLDPFASTDEAIEAKINSWLSAA